MTVEVKPAPVARGRKQGTTERTISTSSVGSFASARPPVERQISILLEDGRTLVEFAESDETNPKILPHVVVVIHFCLIVQTAMYGNSLFAFMRYADEESTISFFGFILISTNIAIIICGHIATIWMSARGSVYQPYLCFVTSAIIGHVMVSFVNSIPKNSRWVLLVARAVIGFGFGGQTAASTVLFLRVSEGFHSNIIQSTANMAGMVSGSLVAGVFTKLDFPGLIDNWYDLEMFTVAAFICICLGLLQVLIATMYLRNITYSLPPAAKKSTGSLEVTLSKTLSIYTALVCIGLRFTLIYLLTFDRALSPFFAMMMLERHPFEIVFINCIIQIFLSIIDLAGGQLIPKLVPRIIAGRVAILIALFLSVAYFLVMFPWPSLPIMVSQANASDNFTSIHEKFCPYNWCSCTHRVTLYQYVMGKICLASSLLLGLGPVASLFTAALRTTEYGIARVRQAFNMAQNVAILTAPLVATVGYEHIGPNVAIGIGIGICGSATFMFIIFETVCYIHSTRNGLQGKVCPENFDRTPRPSYSAPVFQSKGSRRVSIILPSGGRIFQVITEDNEEINGMELKTSAFTADSSTPATIMTAGSEIPERRGSVVLPAVTFYRGSSVDSQETNSISNSVIAEEPEVLGSTRLASHTNTQVRDGLTALSNTEYNEESCSNPKLPMDRRVSIVSLNLDERVHPRAARAVRAKSVSAAEFGKRPPPAGRLFKRLSTDASAHNLRRRATLFSLGVHERMPSEKTKNLASALQLAGNVDSRGINDTAILRV